MGATGSRFADLNLYVRMINANTGGTDGTARVPSPTRGHIRRIYCAFDVAPTANWQATVRTVNGDLAKVLSLADLGGFATIAARQGFFFDIDPTDPANVVEKNSTIVIDTTVASGATGALFFTIPVGG